MTDHLNRSAGDSASAMPAPPLARELDTTGGSVIHYVVDCLPLVGFGKKFVRIKLYIASLVVAFIPLAALAAGTGPVSLFHPTASVKLPFLYDLNVMFMFLISFPCIVILAATDQKTLADALEKVLSDGTIEITDERQIELANSWRKSFRCYNVAGQLLGIVVGAAVAYFNYCAYVLEPAGLWITYYDRLLPVGYFFLYCIWLFYTVITVYVVRSLAIALLLREIVVKAKFHMLPLHPDKAGGLRPVGQLGLRNQYALTLFGLNVALLLLVNQFLNKNDFLIGLTIAAIVAYLVIGPFVFVAALLPFRNAMQDNKARLMKAVALRTRRELDRLARQPIEEPITKDDEELIDRLRKIGAVIDEFPVWPFDAVTLRKFLTAYFIPILSAAYPIAKAAVGGFNIKLPFF
jgi:hypothetical protein